MTDSNSQSLATRPTNSPALPQLGKQLGKYLLLDNLGHGGAGEVYLAHHNTLKIAVAVKILRPAAMEEDYHLAEQLKTEARLLAQLNHPNLVRIWDYEDHAETPYLVMEYVGGSDLAALIQKSGGLRPDRALELILQIAEGLKEAHAHGIIHRDIKPANILITKEGSAKLADLGQALVNRDATSECVTGRGGTPHYMPPEQFDPSTTLDARSDIYSLGVTFYHALTGQTPFSGTSSREVLLLQVNGEAIPPHERAPAVPEAWSQVVLTMMARNPDDRYSSCEELLTVLRSLRSAPAPAQQLRETRPTSSTATRKYPKPPQSSVAVGGGTNTRFANTRPAAKPTSPGPSRSAQLLQDAITAVREGKKTQARTLLREATAFDAKNETAWLWLASVAITPQESLTCAERVLELNPANRQAQQWQQRCQTQIAKAVPRKCPFCLALGTHLDAMCGGCGAILGLHDIELIFTTAPLVDTASVQSVVKRCEAALGIRPTFLNRYLLGLALLNLQEFDKAILNLQSSLKWRAEDQTLARQVQELQDHWAALRASPRHSSRHGSKCSILTIDDSPTVCKLVSVVLQRYGYRVVTANGGMEGLDQLRRDQPDLILLDIMMPGVDGFQLCKLIRSDPRSSRIPVVFLSGKEGMLTRFWARMAGSTAYVTKPFKEEELVQVVEQYCRK